MSDPITEDWLRDNGFKFTEPPYGVKDKHWLLWMGCAVRGERNCYSTEDLGLELSPVHQDAERWHCWVRADYAGRYSRFVHIRHMRYCHEVVALISAMTGESFMPGNCYCGSLRTTEDALRLKKQDEEDLHRRMAREWGKRVEAETGADPDKREVLKP